LNQSHKTRVDPPQPGLGGAGLWVGMKPGGMMNKPWAVLDGNRGQVDSRADPPRPSTNQAVVGAGYKAFGFVAQPSRGLKKPITKMIEEAMSP